MKPRLVLVAVLLLPAWLLLDLRCSPAVLPQKASSASTASFLPEKTAPVPLAVASPPAPDLFVSTVRPILTGHCAPCHETGGVMYERLPFDHADVVAAHSSGVLKRIKAPDERAAIQKWLATLPRS